MEENNTPNPLDLGGDNNGGVPPVDTAADEGTDQTDTDTTGQETVDYRTKFIESSKGAQALLERNKQLEAELAKKQLADMQDLTVPPPQTDEPLYPGFEELDEEARKNLIAYTDMVTARAKKEIMNDPSIAFAKSNYNGTKWDQAFGEISAKFPQLAAVKDEFKAKYYNPQNVPENISEILESMAKIYLFDKAQDIGIAQAQEVAARVQLEDPTGGDKTPTVHRSLADWARMAQTDPVGFAKSKKQYEADLASGKLKE